MSTEQQHTRGPWIFYADTPSVEPNWYIVTNQSRMRVIANIHIKPGNGQDIANARLVAAAPDLLEFAEEVRRSGDTRLASMAIAVIAKAKEAAHA